MFIVSLKARTTRSTLSNAQQDRTNTEIGRKGEELAANFLSHKGIEIVQLNFRYGRAEIDIIAIEKGVLLFVEVKYRTSLLYGYPEEFVDAGKKKRIKSAAEHYIFERNWLSDIRFDIVSIVNIGKKVAIEHFEDCF